MTIVILESSDISKENICWEINKLRCVQQSTELIQVEVSGKIFHLIACWKGKFIPWSMPKSSHGSQDSH